MKLKTLILGAAALTFAASAFADVTVNITGATAFRAATLDAIKAKFVASGEPFKFGHDKAAGGTTFNGSTRSIWIGTFPGVLGTTTIRTCFTGSVEGVRALVPVADPIPPTYYQPSLLANVTAIPGGAELGSQGETGAATDTSHIAFSDVSKASTPYSGYSLKPTNPDAGVVVFTMLTNQGSPITNVTAQQFRALLSTGFQPLSLFTGNSAHTTNVFVTGRNDGSGTRTTYLAETGFGITKPVQQFIVNVSADEEISTIQLVPVGGVNSPILPGQSAKNASTVWGQNVAGNGGHNSGGDLTSSMGRAGTAVNVLDETGANAFGEAVPAHLVTWVSVNDAVTARNNGAIFCAYNGVKLDGIAAGGTTMTQADLDKVTGGVYTAWGYEKMYYRNDIVDTDDKKEVYDGLKAAIPDNLASAGIALDDMHVSRSSDGGVVGPK